jgi:hypothetical protein
MAAAIRRPVSTVQSWKSRGSIPDDHKGHVLLTAQMLGVALGPVDFFPVQIAVNPPQEDAA